MSRRAHTAFCNKILRVDAALPVSEMLGEIRTRRASHVAVFAQGQCLGASSFSDTVLPPADTTFKDLVESQPCPKVSDATSLEELGSLFSDSNIDALALHNDSGEFVGVVTRQSLLDALLKERKQTDELNIALSNAMPRISRLDIEGRYVEVNGFYAEALGYEPDDLIGSDWSPTVHPEDIPGAIQAYQAMCRDGKSEFEARAIRKDRSIFHKRVLMVRIDDSNGVMTGHHCFMRDISVPKQAEEALRESELRLKTIIGDAPVVIISVDPSGKIDLFDGRALESVGFRPGQFTGENYFDLWKDRPCMTRSMRECLSGKTPAPTTMDIADRLIETRYSPLRGADGRVTGATTVCVDITERVRTEEQLQVKNSVLEGITQLQREFLVDTDSHQSFDQILGFLIEVTSSEYGFIGEVLHRPDGKPYLKTYSISNIAWDDETRTFYEQNAPNGLEFDHLETLFGAVLTSGETVIANNPASDPRAGGLPSGHPPMNNFLGLPFFHFGKLVGMIGIANRKGGYDQEIIDTLTPVLATCASLVHAYHLDRRRKEAEQSLRASETRSRTLLEGSPVCTKIIDLDFRLQYMSCAGQNQLKVTDIEPFYGSVFPPELYPEIWRAPVTERLERAKAGETSSLECPVLDTEGNEIWFDTTFVPARDEDGTIQYLIVTSVNVTERRQAEEEARKHRSELAHVSRVSTMGEMATGLAHELNQPLAAIATYSHVAKSMVEQLHSSSDKLQGVLGNLEEQAMRAGDIVRRLRSFLKKSDSVRVSADLNKIVQDVAKFVDPDIRQAAAALELDFDCTVLPVQVDVIQIQQVLVNLIRNAIDAMDETPADQRLVKVSNRILQEGQVEVAVRDAGKGLPPDDLKKAFKAFFTTKQEGMGMGLAISRSIVESHGGKLWAKPNDGPGVTFGFTLEQPAEIATGELDSDDVEPIVFIVEDETVARDSLSLAVEDMGLSARCFSSAAEFLAFFDPYHISVPVCLIADLQMPGISGIDLLEHLRIKGKELPVIIVTGHGEMELRQKAEELGAVVIVEKPFRTAELEEGIAALLKRSTDKQEQGQAPKPLDCDSL